MKTASLEKALDPFKRLFWKAQIDIMRGCPPLIGVLSKVGLGAADTRKIWVKRMLRLLVQAPCAVFQHQKNQREGRVVLSRVVPLVTTRCTLNCAHCALHVPYLSKRGDAPASDMIRDIQALLACVDHIYVIVLTGGEPLLHPDLDQIIRACVTPNKVGLISFTTNGTIIPGAKTLAAIKEADVLVKISKYPGLQPDAEKLKQVLKESGIRYIHESSASWDDLGTFGQAQEGSAEDRFSHCIQTLHWPVVDGKLHLCAQTALMAQEGIFPDHKEEYINLRTVTPAQFGGQLKRLLMKSSVTACSYCLGCTYKSRKVPIAVQRASPQE